MNLTSIVWLVFYMYATVGVEILSTNYQGSSSNEQYTCDKPGNDIVYQIMIITRILIGVVVLIRLLILLVDHTCNYCRHF